VSTPKHVDDLLLASIQDVQTSISANDSKASAALIVHGLVFTGLTELLVNLGGVYHRASEAQRVIGLIFLFLVLIAFLISIYYILRALLPYRPEKVEKALGENCREVFFPLRILDEPDPYASFAGRMEELRGEEGIWRELASERLKLADILRYESNNTRRGYQFLRFEIAFTAAFLIVIATAVL
jgi:NADH:ubiquinone oxidoreductase subunit 3 (subunit A)